MLPAKERTRAEARAGVRDAAGGQGGGEQRQATRAGEERDEEGDVRTRAVPDPRALHSGVLKRLALRVAVIARERRSLEGHRAACDEADAGDADERPAEDRARPGVA